MIQLFNNIKILMKRRDLLKGLSVLPFAGGILGIVAPFES